MKTIEVVAAIITEKDSILVTKRKSGTFKDLWEFPGGKMESGELKEEALIREIFEELNLKISVNDLLITIEHTYPDFHLTMHTFWCKIIEGNMRLNDHNEAKWITANELELLEWVPADIKIINKIMDTYLVK